MAARLTIVSDSHLSAKTPEADATWAALVDHVVRTKPDAVVHTGDIALDGAGDVDDLRHARRRLDEMPGPMLAIPGNHDLGDNPCETNLDSSRLITHERLSRYRHEIGDDRWAVDLGSWRLIGFNAQLLGSGLDDESDQWDWLANELEPQPLDGAATERNVAVFLHKPLFLSDPHPADDDLPIRYVRPASRARLLAMFEAAGVRVVVSGHVHQHHRHEALGMNHVWAPTAWATLSTAMQATIGERWVGGLDLDLGDDGSATVRPVRPESVGQHIIGETIPNPYGADH